MVLPLVHKHQLAVFNKVGGDRTGTDSPLAQPSLVVNGRPPGCPAPPRHGQPPPQTPCAGSVGLWSPRCWWLLRVGAASEHPRGPAELAHSRGWPLGSGWRAGARRSATSAWPGRRLRTSSWRRSGRWRSSRTRLPRWRRSARAWSRSSRRSAPSARPAPRRSATWRRRWSRCRPRRS